MMAHGMILFMKSATSYISTLIPIANKLFLIQINLIGMVLGVCASLMEPSSLQKD